MWIYRGAVAYIIKSSTVLRRQHYLNRRIITRAHAHIGRQRHLRHTDGAGVRVVGGTFDFKDREHGVTHVGRDSTPANVDVDEGRLMAAEPGWLKGDSTAGDGPFGAIARGGHAAT